MPFKSMVASIGTGLVNNALSQENASVQRDWQEKMWKMQNAYNHPSAMADRMRSAGLNPYMMQGAQPAGSIGTGATAQTIPLDNPLAYAKTFAEIDNLTANTNKTETETDKLLKDMSMLDLMYSRGLLEKEEYEFKLNKYYEAWEKLNPFTLEAENTQADTDLKKAQADTEESKQENLSADTGLKKAETTSITDANTRANQIHELNKQVLNNQISIGEYEAKLKENEAYKSDTDRFIRQLTGVDMDSLNPVLVPLVYQFGEAERIGKLTDEQFTMFVDYIEGFLSAERQMYLKSDPDYISALQGHYLTLEQRKQTFAEVIAQFNADIAEQGLRLKSIEVAEGALNILKKK